MRFCGHITYLLLGFFVVVNAASVDVIGELNDKPSGPNLWSGIHLRRGSGLSSNKNPCSDDQSYKKGFRKYTAVINSFNPEPPHPPGSWKGKIPERTQERVNAHFRDQFSQYLEVAVLFSERAAYEPSNFEAPFDIDWNWEGETKHRTTRIGEGGNQDTKLHLAMSPWAALPLSFSLPSKACISDGRVCTAVIEAFYPTRSLPPGLTTSPVPKRIQERVEAYFQNRFPKHLNVKTNIQYQKDAVYRLETEPDETNDELDLKPVNLEAPFCMTWYWEGESQRHIDKVYPDPGKLPKDSS